VRRRTPASARLDLVLDAALLPVREVVMLVQSAGLEVRRVRLRPGGSPTQHQLDLTYSGETAPEGFVQLFEHLQNLPGVDRVTSAAAVPLKVTKPDGQVSADAE